MPDRTSCEARAITFMLGSGRASFRFSPSRRRMFSTSTTESSTSSPRPMAMPPRVMVLMVRPIRRNTMALTSSEIGIASSEMAVGRTLARKMISTTATIITASRSRAPTLPIASLIISAWL